MKPLRSSLSRRTYTKNISMYPLHPREEYTEPMIYRGKMQSDLIICCLHRTIAFSRQSQSPHNATRETPCCFWQLRCSGKYSRGAVSRKSCKVFGSEKPFLKLRSTYSKKKLVFYSMVSKYEKTNSLQNFMSGNAFGFKIRRKLCHPKFTRKVSGVSRNARAFGCHNFLRILKTKTFPGMKFCNEFALSYLEIIVKDQLFRITGSQF